MSLKLKALGLGLLATLAMSAVAVMNAAANSTGHFTAGAHHVTVSGTEDATHKTEFTVPGQEGLICANASYSATVIESDTTAEVITVKPTYSNCTTTDGVPGEVHVDMNGCDYTFTVGTNATPTQNTVTIDCTPPNKITITHTNSPCDIAVPAQTNKTGVGYHTHLTSGGKHALTVSLDVHSITAHIEGPAFPCAFVSTTRAATMEGSVTMIGKDNGGNPVDITATGSVS